MNQSQSVIQPLEEKKPNKGGLLLVIIFFAILLGVGSGFGLNKLNLFGLGGGAKGEKVKTATEIGVRDETTFKDSAEGKLVKGGVDSEGTHHLVRSGGASQNVYLTSSVVNLDNFVGKKVKVYGLTIAAQKAGWLMDVGRVEIE